MGYPEVIRWLNERADIHGAWGYLPDNPASPEPTLLAVAAGAPPPLDWLRDTDLSWGNLLAPAALQDSPTAAPTRDAALGEVLTRKGEAVSATPGSYSPSLQGWSWVEGTFSWVEPTAWGLLSLRASGLGDHPRATEAVAVLEDRQCTDGGWNAGTPDVLGAALPGYLYMTGWAVLALPPGDAAERGLRFLNGVLERPSTMNLSLAVLAQLAHGHDPTAAADLLRARQQPDGGFGERCDRAAIAGCALRALDGSPRPLRVDPSPGAR